MKKINKKTRRLFVCGANFAAECVEISVLSACEAFGKWRAESRWWDAAWESYFGCRRRNVEEEISQIPHIRQASLTRPNTRFTNSEAWLLHFRWCAEKIRDSPSLRRHLHKTNFPKIFKSIFAKLNFFLTYAEMKPMNKAPDISATRCFQLAPLIYEIKEIIVHTSNI